MEAKIKFESFNVYGEAETISYPARAGAAIAYPADNVDMLTYNARGDLIDFLGRNGGTPTFVHTTFEFNARRQPTRTLRWYQGPS